MWLSRPVYEGLPFVYVGLGVVSLIVSALVRSWHWPVVFTVVGLASITGGLVVWLKRRDYRTSRSRAAFDERR
jgi:hypothetical protein